MKEAIAEEVAEEGVTEEAAAERDGTKVGYTRAMPECEERSGVSAPVEEETVMLKVSRVIPLCSSSRRNSSGLPRSMG